MIHANIVFLVDINGVPRGGLELGRVQKEPQDEGGGDSKQQNGPMDILPFRQGEEHSSDSFAWLREFVLLTLFREANNKSNDYDFGRVQWSFKFFDSSRHVDFRDGRAFVPFDYDSFANFEKQLGQRLGASGTEQQFDTWKVKYLSDAIKAITGSLSWPENESLNLSASFNGETPVVRNMVYAFTRVPRTEKELAEFGELQLNSATKDFMGVLLPSAFSARFHHHLKIQLNFVDMWSAPENIRFAYLPSWNGEYPRQILRCLGYLGSGKILPVSDTSILKNGPMNFGLVPYPAYLRSRLQQASQRNENVPSHIKHLVPGAKVSPDLDTSSVTISRSMKSNSILETSTNNQSKVLRPFRLSSGYDNFEDSYEYNRPDFKGQDRLRARETDRKRKRHDYEFGDYITKHENRRMIEDDIEADRAETDSECDREKRLESWVNDGVFNINTKRNKRHVDTTTSAIPSSRTHPNKNKSTHVFHEPAPRLPTGSRGKKMLATVERQKVKVHAVETKRRSSEGMDMKRITQKQEKELSAIKRRLRIHLQGELDFDEGKPDDWLGKFNDQLKDFADMILEEDDPCLVALAQALVNYASSQFNQKRVTTFRELYRQPLTSKDLLEKILLLEFTSLNKKIINAHEATPGTSSVSRSKLRRRLAFRETELQIILRLEIAWCFVNPDDDATQDVLAEIVRLLKIINAYRTQPPIDYFINKVLLPTYSQCNRFMRSLYKEMNIPLPIELAMDGSPVPSSSRHDDDASMISSTSSANLYPEDSASQLHVNLHKRRRPSPTVKRSIGLYQDRKTNSGTKKARRQILVAHSNPRLVTTSQYLLDRSDSQRKHVPGAPPVKNSPKRVRRNLFDVKKMDRKDSKTLMTLSNSARLTKSPAFRSPKGKSPLSPSAFFRAARRGRQFGMGQGTLGSPTMNSDVLCPESPATPGCDKRSVSSKYAPTTTSTGSGDRNRVIQESPEVVKNDFESRQMNRVSSLSFYSSGNDAKKSRAWEKSETQLMAARIKDSVDLRSNRNLTLNDLEFLPSSPNQNLNVSSCNTDTPGTNLSLCEDSYVGRQTSPMPSVSKSQSLLELTGPAPDLNNPNIEALIRCDSFPIQATVHELPLKTTQREPEESPKLPPASTASPSNLETPSKRVQFNLNENLVNTPASTRRSNSATPKSILKETHD